MDAEDVAIVRQTLHESGHAFDETFTGEEGEDWLDEFRMDGEVAGRTNARSGSAKWRGSKVRSRTHAADSSALERYVEALAAAGSQDLNRPQRQVSDVFRLDLVEVLDLHGRAVNASTTHRFPQLGVVDEALGSLARIESVGDEDTVGIFRRPQYLLEPDAAVVLPAAYLVVNRSQASKSATRWSTSKIVLMRSS